MNAPIARRGRGVEFAKLCQGTRLECDGLTLRSPMPEARGTVRQVSIDDPQDNFVMVELEAAPRRSLLGPVAIFENDGQQDAAYTIQSLRRSGKLHRLSVGDKTFIRGYSNPRDFDSDFVLNVQPGDTVRIPGSVCFS